MKKIGPSTRLAASRAWKSKSPRMIRNNVKLGKTDTNVRLEGKPKWMLQQDWMDKQQNTMDDKETSRVMVAWSVKRRRSMLLLRVGLSIAHCCLAHNHSNGNELRILMQIKLISLTIAEHQDSLRNRDKQQLGNGPFTGGDNVRRTRHMREIRMYSKSTEKPLALGGTANLFWEEILWRMANATLETFSACHEKSSSAEKITLL